MKKYLIIISIVGFVATQEDGNDGKYIPDSIPVWEHERQDYTFSYGVKDLHTGDIKNQWEKKVGDTVHGHYTVLEPDGSLRIVDYTADEKNGFNAIVKHEGPSYHPVTTGATSHTQFHIKPQQHIEKPKPKPMQQTPVFHQPKEHQDDTQSVNIEPESETDAIDAYLFIPSQQQDEEDSTSTTKVSQYELVSDDKYQHFVSYEPPQNHKNHKAVYSTIQPNLKIKSKQQLKSFNYDLLAPVTIDLAQINLDHYQQILVEPEIETGFQPIKKTKTAQQHDIPNTFTTNKKPVTTPGLKTFASENRGYLRGPVIFPKRVDKGEVIQITPIRKGITYTKHVSYFPDDY